MAGAISVAELSAKLTADTTQFTGAMQKAQTDADTFAGKTGSKLSSFGDTMTGVGKKMTLGLTLPIVGLGAAAINMAGDFEQSLNVLQAVSGATGKEMEDVSQKAKDLGADISLPGTSAKDAALAMTELAKGGLTVKESMDAAKGVLQLSAAANISNADAATIAVNAMSAFNLKATDMVKINDVLAGASNASSAEITDVALAFQQAASSFAQGKQPMDTLATAIGIMANNGIKGSDAGTSLKTMMAALTPQTDKAAAALDKLGIDAFRADGTMKGFRQIIQEAQPALRKMTDEQRMMTLETAFGSDAVRAASIVLGAGVEEWDKMSTAVNRSGQAADVAAARNKGVKGALDALKSSVETAAITFGEQMAPVIKTVANLLSGLVGFFSALPDPIKKVVVVLGALVALAGPLAMGIGMVTKAFLFLQANPIVLTITGIVVAIAALAAGLIYAYNHVEGFRKAVDAIGDVFQSVWGSITNIVGEIVDAFQEFGLAGGDFADSIDRILGGTGALKGPLQTVFSLIQRGIDIVKGIVSAFQEFGFSGDFVAQVDKVVGAGGRLEQAFTMVRNAVGATIEWIRANVAPVFGQLGTALGRVFEMAKPVFDFLGDHAKQILIGLGAAFLVVTSPIGAAVAAIVLLWTKCTGFRDAINGLIEFLVTKVVPVVAEFAASMLKEFGGMIDWIVATIPQIAEAVTHVFNVIKGVIETVMPIVIGIVQVALGVLAAIWRAWGDDIWNVVKTILNFIQETIQNALQFIKGVISFFLALINGDWGAAWDAIKNIVGAVWDMIGNIISTAVGIVKSIIGGFISTLQQIWNGAWEAFKNLVSGAWETVKSTVSGGVGAVVGFIAGLPGRLVTAAGDLFGFLRDKMTEAKDWIGNRVNDIVAFIKSIPSKIGNIGKEILDKITPDLGSIPVVGGAISKIPGIGGLFKAAGGPVSAMKPYIVGEQGPELMVPRSAGTIVPNQALGVGGGGPTYNITEIHLTVEGSVLTDRTLTDVVHEGLKAKKRRTGDLKLV